jgi:thioesterase domain-containing protein/aryl carrier-like protein
MVPAAFVHLAALPLTPNGKIDRKALPAPEGDAFGVCAYQAPQGAVEQTLAEIWSKLFHIKWIGRFDNFFDLGGHSLLAVQMMSMLKQAGLDVQIATLFTHPTIERLAANIEGQENSVLPNGAIPIRRAEGDGHRPLFLVHDVSGELFYARLLAGHIDAHIPVYGLVDNPLGTLPMRTIYDGAKRLLRTIRAVQPFGPYRIAGWSFGGVLAYEIATQLAGENETVEFLGLIDAVNYSGNGHKERMSPDDRAIVLGFIMGMVDTADLSLKAQLKTLAQSVDLETLVRTCQEKQILPPALSFEDIRNYIFRIKTYDHAHFDYRPTPIPIPIHLFKAMERMTPDLDDHLGWADVLPETQIRVISVPGTHQSMIEPPQIEILGTSVSDAIQQACAAEKSRTAQDDASLISL